MEPEGITLFTDIGAISSQPTFGCLRLQSQGIHHRSSRYLETEVGGSLVSSVAQARLRNKFQKPPVLPDPEEPLDLEKEPSKQSLELAPIAQKAKFDKPRRLPSRGDSLIEVAWEESGVEETDRGHLWRRASVAECSLRDCPDGMDHRIFANRRSASIRIPSSSKEGFQPKRNKSIGSKFSAVKFQEDEIWVETFDLNNEGKMEYFFKGLKGQECLGEPPTGAVNIIYLEDVLPGEPDDSAVVNNIKKEMSTPSMIQKGKKKSKWTSFVQKYKSSRTLVRKNRGI